MVSVPWCLCHGPCICSCLPADLILEAKRDKTVAKAKKLVGQTLAATAFAGCPMVAVAARPGTAAP
jgi:hypothetical protein